MGRITIDQSHQVIATLVANTDWGAIDFKKSGLQDLIIRNPKEAGRQFTAFLKNGGRMIAANFPTFRTIKLGTQKDAKALYKAIIKAGGYVSDLAYDIMAEKKFTVAKKETEVELVVASVAELGFKDGAKYSAICERAKNLDLNLCPAEVGPQLRLQYLDQPKGEWLRIAMEPITDSDGYLYMFNVEHDVNGLWLGSHNGLPDDSWSGYYRFVFIRGN